MAGLKTESEIKQNHISKSAVKMFTVVHLDVKFTCNLEMSANKKVCSVT